MAAKMAVYYKKHKKIYLKNIRFSLRLANTRDLHVNANFTDSELQTCNWCIIQNWYIQDGVQDGSWQVRGIGILPVGMSGGFVMDQMSCLMEKHFTNMCI